MQGLMDERERTQARMAGAGGSYTRGGGVCAMDVGICEFRDDSHVHPVKGG